MKRIVFYIMTAMFCMGSQMADAKISLEDVVDDIYRGNELPAVTPLMDGEHYLTMGSDRSTIIKCSFKDGSVTDTVLDLSTAKGNDGIKLIEGFILSPNEDRLLVQTHTEYLYRNSFSAEYYLFTIKNNRLEHLSSNGPQQSPKFSPDGNVIGFVRNGNIFIVKLLYNNAESQVTNDGKPGQVYNGIPDWSYDEEFTFTSAFNFSADSKMIAYIRFEMSNVDSLSLPYFQRTLVRSAHQQPLLYNKDIQYPAAGAATAKVSVHSFDIKSSVIRKIDLDIDSTTYIPRIEFVDDDKSSIFIFTINRTQNRLEIYAANPRSTICHMVLRHEDERYIETNEYMDTQVFGKQFIMQSERDGHNHLYLYNLNGTLIQQITKGDWDVLELLGFDQENSCVYYASNEGDPYSKRIYKMTLKGKKTSLSVSANYNSAVFSSNFKFFLNSASDLNTPTVISLMNNDGKTTKVIKDNKELCELISKDGFVKKEMFNFKTSDGVVLYGWIMKPEDADASKPCPLIMFQYSGPGANKVTNSWTTGFYAGASFENYLVQQGYAVAVVDGRGTGLRGAEFKKCTYMRLGVLESKDQVETAKYLGNLPDIDANRIGIWGWSYGGYNTLMSMSEGTPVFRAGIAIAPVTDWRFYSAPYTERYMRMPKENADGYENSSAISRIDKLNGRLLIVHGLDDNNVLFSNTASYIEKLIEKGIQFDMQIYPGKDHSISGRSTRLHLLNKMVEFMNSELKN